MKFIASRQHIMNAFIIFILLITLFACSDKGKLDYDDLHNVSVKTELYDKGQFTLTNGRFEDKELFFTAQIISEQILTTDLNRDGSEDAIIPISINLGGSGSFVILTTFLNEYGEPTFVSEALIGDRVKIKSIIAINGEPQLQIITHGKDDALCCPTFETTLNYKLDHNKLLEKSNFIGTYFFRNKESESNLYQLEVNQDGRFIFKLNGEKFLKNEFLGSWKNNNNASIELKSEDFYMFLRMYKNELYPIIFDQSYFGEGNFTLKKQ